MWQGKVRYAHSTTPLSIQQEYSVLISPQHISLVAPSITFYLNYRGKEIGDTSEKWCPSRESNPGPSNIASAALTSELPGWGEVKDEISWYVHEIALNGGKAGIHR